MLTHFTDQILLPLEMRKKRGENIIEMVLYDVTENVLNYEVELKCLTANSKNVLLGLIGEEGHDAFSSSSRDSSTVRRTGKELHAPIRTNKIYHARDSVEQHAPLWRF